MVCLYTQVLIEGNKFIINLANFDALLKSTLSDASLCMSCIQVPDIGLPYCFSLGNLYSVIPYHMHVNVPL